MPSRERWTSSPGRSRGLVGHAPDALLVSESHRLLFPEGAITRLREDERGKSVLAGHGRGPLLANCGGEALELSRVRVRVALREVVDPIHCCAVRCEPDVVDAPVIADADRRPRAEHFRRALVSVAGNPAPVDHSERPAREAQHDDGVVDVAHLREPRVRERSAECRHLLDLADEPARCVEVVDGDVDEEPAGVSDVVHWRRLLVAQSSVEEVDLAELAGLDPGGRCSPVRIKAALEADLPRDARAPRLAAGQVLGVEEADTSQAYQTQPHRAEAPSQLATATGTHPRPATFSQ